MLRRLARDASVGARRRGERERRFAPEERQPATDEVVARAELEHRVADAVLALAEPYRTTVLLTFFENLKPRAIAMRMAVPVETVRTRIKRGVELVRARIVIGSPLGGGGGDGETRGALALVGLLDGPARRAVRRVLLAKAAGAAVGGGAGVFLLTKSASLVTATKAAVVAVAIATVALTTVAIRSRAAQATPTARVAAASAPEHPDATSRDHVDGGTARAPEAVDDEPGSDAWLARYGFVVTPSVEGGLPIHVRRADGSAAAGVVVFVFDDAGLTTEKLAALTRDPVAMHRGVMSVHRTDVRGDVAIRWLPRGSQALLALAGSLRAGRQLGITPRPPIELVLRNPASLAVTVVDRSGHPCGDVPVAFGYRLDSAYANGGVRVVTSAPDGSATLPDVDIRPDPPLRSATWFVAVECGAQPESEVSIDPDAPPAAPIVLKLGAAGALELDLVDEREEPVAFDGEMTLQLEQGQLHYHRRTAKFRDGRALVAPLGLGVEWTLWSSLKARSLLGTHGSGPQSDGETIVARLHASAPGPFVTGRAVDGDGLPLRDRLVDALDVEVVNVEGDGGCNGFQVRTDDDGRFEFDFHNVRLGLFRRRLVLTLGGDGRGFRRAFVALPSRLAREVVSLGDVVMEEVAPTLCGRVVDLSGRPLAGTRIWIADDDLRASVEDRERFGLSMAWSDDDGRFAIVGWPAGRYHVDADRDGYRRRPRELSGADDVLRLPRNDVTLTLEHESIEFAWLLGGVVADPLFHQALRQVEIRLRPRDAEAPIESNTLQDDGTLNLGSRRSGTYDAIVTLRGVDDPREVLATLEGVEMRTGAVTVDPRLENLDLRGRLHALAVKVVDADGGPVEAALVRVHLGDERERTSRFAYAGRDPARFLTSQPVLDVEALGPNGTRATAHAVSGEVTLRLAPARRAVVHLRIERPDAIRGQPVTLTAKLLPAKSGLDGTVDWLTATFDTDGAASLVLPCGGEWCVTVSARVRARFPMPPEDVVPAPVPLTILDDADEANCSVHLDEEKLAMLLERAKGG